MFFVYAIDHLKIERYPIMKSVPIVSAFILLSSVTIIPSCATATNFSQEISKQTGNVYNVSKTLANEYCEAIQETTSNLVTKEPETLNDNICVVEITPNSKDPITTQDIIDKKPIEPGNIYVTNDVTPLIFVNKFESYVNERGILTARLDCVTSNLSILQWAFNGDVSYHFAYLFIWFDKDGNVVPDGIQTRIREAFPNTSVQFIGHAPNENCKQFSLILYARNDLNKNDVEYYDNKDTLISSTISNTDVAIENTVEEQKNSGRKTADDTKKLIEENK